MNGYLKLVSEAIEGERRNPRANFAALYRSHAPTLRAIRDGAADPTERLLATEYLRSLLLALTTPDPDVRDGLDGYTGEPLFRTCSLDCDWLMGDEETHVCTIGVSCELGKPCPWECEPGIPRGKLTWEITH